MHCRVPVICNLSGMEVGATVVDLGMQGMRLVLPTPLTRGSRILVGSKPEGSDLGGPVFCKVVWVLKSAKRKAYQAGLRFDDSDEAKASSWMRPVLSRLGFAKGKIREKRVDVRLEVHAHVPVSVQAMEGELLGDGVLVDFSRRGAQISVDTQIPKETQIFLSIGPVGTFSPLECPGLVLLHYKDVAAQRYFHRVRFHSLTSPISKRVRQYFRFLQKEISPR
jgi:hypothetical protein